MTYATKQQMIDRFGETELIQLTDEAGLGVIDDVKIGDCLQDADDEINTFLAARYALPLSSVPKVLVRWACDAARYFLYDDQATEQVRKRYEDVRRSLEAVAKGTLSLGLDETASETATESGTVAYEKTDDDRQFTRDTLASF
ncbi:MAG: gp436 family protein [Vicinamibacterales bacterium]